MIPVLAAEEMIRNGIHPPKMYRTTEKAALPSGGHLETGSWICPQCMGTWAPEMSLMALTHAHRGACVAEHREHMARYVPYKPLYVFKEYPTITTGDSITEVSK